MAPHPTNNNGNSHPSIASQSHDNSTSDSTDDKAKSPDTGPYTPENNGNSQLDKSFVEVATNSAKLRTREKIKTT